MSLFGYFVVGRAPGPLSDVEPVRRVCSESGTLAAVAADGDWQFVQIFDGTGLHAADVTAETGYPALVVYVIESEVGVIDAATPDGEASFNACLNPAEAVRALDVPEEIAGTPEETASLAADWAKAAGRTADHTALVAAVGRRVGGFGEGVDAFVAALGFRFR
jgi:hypothetical protein